MLRVKLHQNKWVVWLNRALVGLLLERFNEFEFDFILELQIEILKLFGDYAFWILHLLRSLFVVLLLLFCELEVLQDVEGPGGEVEALRGNVPVFELCQILYSELVSLGL